MNKKLFISLLILSFVTLYANALLSSFTVKSQNGNVVVSWQATSETNLNHYVVTRRTVNGNFIDIAVVELKADKNYEYIDQTAYKTTDAVYIYQIKIVNKDGSVDLSGERSVVHNVSDVTKRTWGSIKELFR